jgi:hypothetical protein
MVRDVGLVAPDKEPFVGGVVSLSIVLSGVVTASWMLFLLVLLSSNTIPNSLMLANLFHAVGHSVLLSELTDHLQTQITKNFQDTTELRNLFTSSTSFILVKTFTVLFIYISWVDLLQQVTKYEHRKKSLLAGLGLSVLAFSFSLPYEFLFKSNDHGSKEFVVIKVFHYTFNLLLLTWFNYRIVKFTIEKKKFAYHRKSMALALFALFILVAPYAFTLVDIISDLLRSWCSYVAVFSNLCVTVIIWEWLHTIRSLERKYETKAILGRRISNDSFTQADQKSNADNSSYILKSLNIVAFFIYLNSKVSSFFQSLIKRITEKFSKNAFNSDNFADSAHSNQDVLLYELHSMRNSSQHSHDQMSDNISLVGEYPQFNVDYRYLRNTPSTGCDTRRATPATFASDRHTESRADDQPQP